MRPAVLLLLVVSFAAVAWLVLAEGDARDGDDEGIDRAGEASEAEVGLATLRGREGAAAPARDEEGVSAGPPAPAEAHVEEGRFVLRGTLLGLDATRPGEAHVRVFPVLGMWADRDGEPATCVAGRDGRFTVDLGALFAGSRDLTHVDVVVDHPAYVAAEGRLDVTAARAAGKGRLEIAITLHPGLAITGRVVDPEGRPLAGADVAVFRTGPDGPVLGLIQPVQSLACEKTDTEGRYRLRVAKTGSYLVVAATETWQPAGRDVSLVTGVELEIAPLVLEAGVAIAGRVLYDGAPVVQAYVVAEVSAEQHRFPLQVGDRRVHWVEGQGLRSGASGVTDEVGRFALAGLSPGGYVIDAWSPTLPGLQGVSRAVTQKLGGTVQAPADDVVLEIVGAVLELRTTRGGEAAAEVGLQVATPPMTSTWKTDAHGVLRLLVAPGREHKVSVDDPGYQTGSWTVTSGAAGSTGVKELDLVEAAPKPSLLVTFTGPGAAALERARLQLIAPPADPTVSPGSPPVPPPAGFNPAAEKVGPGTFRLTGLRPGRFTLVANPGRDMWDEAGYHLQIRREVVVPPEGELALRMTLRTGGRLRIAARDAAGALLEADCVIRDAAGETQAVTFSTHGENVVMSQDDSLGNLSPSAVAPPLPAGRYTIELSLGGYEPRSVEVEVKENETTDVDVGLAPR